MPLTPAADAEHVNVTTAAFAVGATPAEVRQLIDAGQLPRTIRLGRRVLHVPARAVFDYLAAPAHNTSEA